MIITASMTITMSEDEYECECELSEGMSLSGGMSSCASSISENW